MRQGACSAGEKVAQVIIAETGGDMSRFPTAGHLASWAGLAPALHESAGRRTGRNRAREPVVVRDASRGRRIGRPDAPHELSRCPARPVDETAWDGPSSGRGRALELGLGVLDAHT
jgi:Transposase IS116/IS110/IS902 family